MGGTGQTGIFDDRWEMSAIRLVNWGACDGSYTFRLACGAKPEGNLPVTVITGQSGTGKSTIDDAVSTLLSAPQDIRYNSASNDQATTRRGERRSKATYIRGKLDDIVDDGTGEESTYYMRPLAKPTWSAIAIEWVNGSGAAFSAEVIMSLGAGKDEPSDINEVYVWSYGTLDPNDISPKDAISQDKGAILAACGPLANATREASTFRTAVWSILNIDRGGNPRMATRIQAILQGSQKDARIYDHVDDLFHTFVIDQPGSVEQSEKLVNDYDTAKGLLDESEAAYMALNALSPLREQHRGYTEALAKRDGYRRVFGTRGEAADDVADWLYATMEVEYLALEKNRETVARDRAESRYKGAAERVREANEKMEDSRAALDSAGGGEIEKIRADIARARSEAGVRRSAAGRVAATLGAAGMQMPADATAWHGLTEGLAKEASDRDDRRDEIQAELVRDAAEVERKKGELARASHTLEALRESGTRITARMQDNRRAIAEATGIDESRMPYVAELVDMAEGCEDWRAAADDQLASITNILLIDSRDDDGQTRRKIDAAAGRLQGRVRHEVVDTDEYRETAPVPGHLSEKLRFAEDNPFVWWAMGRIVGDERLDPELADDAAELGDKVGRLTRAGYYRKGSHGAVGHAHTDRRGRPQPIIGVSNDMLIDDQENEIRDLENDIRALGNRDRSLLREDKDLMARGQAAVLVASTPWETVDAAAMNLTRFR